MLTPQQLYDSYSVEPCEPRQFFNSALYGAGPFGKGTPHYMRRVVQFMKHLRFPCIEKAPGYNQIYNTGKNQISLTYKFLESLDSECFKEVQPTIKSGTSHSVRNACDIARACSYIVNKMEKAWEHRMATEYIQHFGQNSLSDCLMVLGPDLVSDDFAFNQRAPNIMDMDCLPLPPNHEGATGSQGFSCMTSPTEGIDAKPKCRSCRFCPDPPDPKDPCCNPGDQIRYKNLCCGAPLTTRADFSLLIGRDFDENLIDFIPNNIRFIKAKDFQEFKRVIFEDEKSSLMSQKEIEDHRTWIKDTMKIRDAILLLDNQIYAYRYELTGDPNLANIDDLQSIASRVSYAEKQKIESYTVFSFKLKHIGLLPRKIYGGYANLLDNSGENFYAILDEIFIDYFHKNNYYNYSSNISSFNLQSPTFRKDFIENLRSKVARARTISMISADENKSINQIKDLLWNGYGVVLFSNVGFSNVRDSKGISYPDRMWYTTYSILGYDDTKTNYDECVYILHCPWGKWNSGGQPPWGDLPDGAFLVKEQHLKCMLRYYPDRDYFGCRSGQCNPIDDDCENPNGCGGHGLADKCEPYFCASQQSAMGLAFAISLNQGFIPQQLDHTQWLDRASDLRFQEKTLYYKY